MIQSKVEHSSKATKNKVPIPQSDYTDLVPIIKLEKNVTGAEQTLRKPAVPYIAGCAFYYIDKITQMSPIDGPILLISEICLAHTSGVNISKAQPSKAKGLGGVAGPILRILIYII